MNQHGKLDSRSGAAKAKAVTMAIAMSALGAMGTLLGAAALSGCSAGDIEGSYGGDGDSGGGTGIPVGGVPNPGQAGLLTAGELDDHANYDFFLRTLDTVFAQMASAAASGTTDRISLTLVDAGERPASGALVSVFEGGRLKGAFPAGSDGRVHLFPALDGLSSSELTLSISMNGTTVEAAPGEGQAWRYTVPATAALPQQLDLAFAIDATGSMGDELSFLQAEVQTIVDHVTEAFPGVSVRMGFVIYRDIGDDFVTQSFPFTGERDAFSAALAKHRANGGGDYPEAAEAALEKSLELGWRDGNVARLLFHIADAPAHSSNYRKFLDAANAARSRGIRIYPLAASGTAKEAEYLMRSAALLTGGRYLFLTDDSGIGNAHQEPSIPCFQVQRLDELLIRTIASELAGEYRAAPAGHVLRTVGTYENRVCRDPSAPATL